MPTKDRKTVPYETRQQVRKAAIYLDKNFDPAYALAFRIAAFTGLRISDVLHLRYKDNVDYASLKLKLNESKGTLQAKALARYKALKIVKDMLVITTSDNYIKARIYITPVKDIYAMVPPKFKSMVDKQIEDAVAEAEPKYREVALPKQVMMQLKARQKKFKGLDDGLVFARSTVKSNRAKNMGGVISREYVWRVFSSIGPALKLDINTSCHQLRKSFALFLYIKSKFNSALVVKAVGWSNNTILQRYLSIEDKQAEAAVNLFQRGYV